MNFFKSKNSFCWYSSNLQTKTRQKNALHHSVNNAPFELSLMGADRASVLYLVASKKTIAQQRTTAQLIEGPVPLASVCNSMGAGAGNKKNKNSQVQKPRLYRGDQRGASFAVL